MLLSFDEKPGYRTPELRYFQRTIIVTPLMHYATMREIISPSLGGVFVLEATLRGYASLEVDSLIFFDYEYYEFVNIV